MHTHMHRAPAVLSIAGSDPSGGAGLQGDLATLAAMGVYGMAVPTALTVQSRSGVRAVHAIPAHITAASVRAVLDEMEVDAIKIGMLYTAATARAVARELHGFVGPVVLDPVLAASRGADLSAAGLIPLLLDVLCPETSVLTPNLDETEALCGVRPRDLEGMIACAFALASLGCGAVLLKGGHLQGAPVDVLIHQGEPTFLVGPRRITPRTHGTGCALSTAIAALLARGLDVAAACTSARARLDRALASRSPIGLGTSSVAHSALGHPCHHAGGSKLAESSSARPHQHQVTQ